MRTLVIMLIVMLLAGCADHNNQKEVNSSLEAFKEYLDKSYGDISIETASKNILAGERTLIRIGDEEIQVFSYKTDRMAQEDADRISADGCQYKKQNGDVESNIILSWNAPPHFYQKNTIIVLYVGADQTLLDRFSEYMGSVVAGEK